MEYRGEVRDGKIVLDRRAKLAEGTVVAVRTVTKTKPAPKSETRGVKSPKPKSLLERLAPVVGKAKGLPADLARNHDHYLHGQPKK